MTTFAGIPPQAAQFYAALEANCTKEFWDAHRSEYESAVREPVLALTAALEPEFGPVKLFRPYRDTRFSHDKTPYKTHQGALVGDGQGVGYYVQVDAEGLVAGGGFRSHSSGQVERCRAAVDDETGGELAGLAGHARGPGRRPSDLARRAAAARLDGRARRPAVTPCRRRHSSC